MMDSLRNPVWVLSTGRCGTLALQKFLNQSSEVEVFHRYRGRKAKYWNGMSVLVEENYAYYNFVLGHAPDRTKRGRILELLRRERGTIISQLHKEGKGFIETNHGFTVLAPLVREAFPSSKFVYVHRHPRQVISSFIRKFSPPEFARFPFTGTSRSLLGQYVLRYGRILKFARAYLPISIAQFIGAAQFDMHLAPCRFEKGQLIPDLNFDPFGRLLWYWNEVNRFSLDFLSTLQPDQKFQIASNQIFSAETEPTTNLIEFLKITDLTAADAKQFFSHKLNEKDDVTTFPKAGEWTPEMEESLVRMCGSTMERLGYS